MGAVGFKKKMACATPHFVDNPLYPYDLSGKPQLPVPCGRCPDCKQKRTAQWVFRMKQEDKVSSSAYFVTLTYDTEFVPISPHGFMTLQKSDFQKYMKRLRKLHDKHIKIKYYAVGEYGSKTRRPHYHAIIFNADQKSIVDAWSVDGRPIGGVHVGDVNGNSIAYTTKYINKPKRIPEFAADDRVKEFSLMSKGIGKSFLTPQVRKFYKSDLSRNFVVLDGGLKISMPKYFVDKIFDEEEKVSRRSVIRKAVADIEEVSESEYYRDNPDGDYALFCESQRIARYKSFYHFTNQNRKL